MTGRFREFKARLVRWTFFHVSLVSLLSTARNSASLVWGLFVLVLFGGFVLVVLLCFWLFPSHTCRVSTLILMTCAHRTHGVRTRAKKSRPWATGRPTARTAWWSTSMLLHSPAGCARWAKEICGGSNLISHLEWPGSTVRFQHILTEAPQKCIDERPLFWDGIWPPKRGP